MAAPATADITNLSGTWVMNRTMSDDVDDLLQLQGVGWMLRKTLSFATVTLNIKHHTEDGVEKIDIDQVLSGGIKGTAEHRIVDWTAREHTDHVFGTVMSKSKRTTLDDEEIKDHPHFLEGWTQDTLDKKVIVTSAVNKKEEWIATQTWGFQDINGERRHVRKVRVVGTGKKDGKFVEKTLIYDYIGPVN